MSELQARVDELATYREKGIVVFCHHGIDFCHHGIDEPSRLIQRCLVTETALDRLIRSVDLVGIRLRPLPWITPRSARVRLAPASYNERWLNKKNPSHLWPSGKREWSMHYPIRSLELCTPNSSRAVGQIVDVPKASVTVPTSTASGGTAAG